MEAPRHYRYLNREGRWLDFRWAGLELRPDGDADAGLAPAPDRRGSCRARRALRAGRAERRRQRCTEDVFFTDPTAHRLWSVDVCETTRDRCRA